MPHQSEKRGIPGRSLSKQSNFIIALILASSALISWFPYVIMQTLIAARWFGKVTRKILQKTFVCHSFDTSYPGDWEPSGQDFLSPALVEAELMALLLPTAHFAHWLEHFLPDIVNGRPAALFTPAVVSDASDPYIAHLHGLNASRAWCWRRIAESLPPRDDRIERALEAAGVHAQAVLPHVTGEDYMVEHWLACYAVLMLS